MSPDVDSEMAFYPPQHGRLAVVTGAGGLGLETARALARHGACVVVAGRNAEKGQAAVSDIASHANGRSVRFELLDLADLGSVEAFASRLLAEDRAIDLLINNAGIMSPPVRRVSRDGFEAQFATNHLGHFALTARLLPLLLKSSAARVIHVTSLAHRHASLDFGDLQNERAYKAGAAYCQSKLAVALFARALQEHAVRSGWPLKSIAAHPGFAGTNLIAAEQGTESFFARMSRRVIVPLIGQSAKDGARPQIHAALSSEAVGGKLYGPTGLMQMKGPPGECAFGKGALDDDAARMVWQISEELASVQFGGLKAPAGRSLQRRI